MKSLNFQKLNLRKEDVLSKSQMKNILGGYGGGDGNAGCKTGPCYVWNKQTMKMDSGTCSTGTVRVNGVLFPTCDCSLGGGGCYP